MDIVTTGASKGFEVQDEPHLDFLVEDRHLPKKENLRNEENG